MSGHRKSRLGATLLASTCLLIAGCGGDGTGGDGGGGVDQWPLTGLDAADGVADGPVLAVKIDNTADAAPQLGLDKADLVVEEAVEGRVTRLMAMFHSQLGDGPTAGPVRSIRDSDIGIVLPTEGVLVASGGAPGPLERVDDAGVQTAFEEAPGMSRASDRSAPYNLLVDLGTLSGSLDPQDPPGDYLDWSDAAADEAAEEGGDAGSAGATTVTMTFSPAHTTQMQRDPEGDTWRRVGENASGGGFVADNVLALRVELVDAGYVDPGGNKVERTITTGTGDAVLVSGFAVQELSWSKNSDDDIWQLSDADGEEVSVPAGRTWIALVPVEGDVVVD